MSNPYLAKLRGMVGLHQGENVKAHATEPSKPSKRGFEAFEGEPRSRLSQLKGDSVPVRRCRIGGGRVAINASTADPQKVQNRSIYNRVLAALCERCPDHVELDRWRQAIKDGRRFLADWGEQAEALGWTARDLFGLHDVPANPHPSYRRLCRYDCTGLIWMLQGQPVQALSSSSAAIQSVSGSITSYRKRNKPVFGPLGYTFEDFQA
jgi:hypothetical protein